MPPTNDRILTKAIILIAVAGLLYFGIQAVSDSRIRNQDNPFEYNIDHFKQSGRDQVRFSQVRQINLDDAEPAAIAVGPRDRIYVAVDRAIILFNKDGGPDGRFAVNETPVCLAVDENRDIYAGMSDHVQVYDSTGVVKRKWISPADGALFTSIAVSESHVFIADADHLVVWKYDKSGEIIARIGEKDRGKEIPGFVVPSPYFDVAIDDDGFLWAVNPGRLSLENYTEEGDLRASWGEPSMFVHGFCGCCNPTHIALLPDGSFVTSEKGIARVKISNRLGVFVALVAGPDQFDEGTEGLDLAVDSKERIYVLDPKRKAVRIYEKKEEA